MTELERHLNHALSRLEGDLVNRLSVLEARIRRLETAQEQAQEMISSCEDLGQELERLSHEFEDALRKLFILSTTQ